MKSPTIKQLTDENLREHDRLLAQSSGSAFMVEAVAFEGPKEPDRGYTVRASYLKEPHAGKALIEVLKDRQVVRHFLFPAYKIWNIAAHFKDIVDGEIENSGKEA